MSSRLHRRLLTSFDVCHNCLHCCLRCHFSVVFILTLSPASCHYHGLRPALPRFTGFARQSVRMLSIFYIDCRFLNTVANTISVVCMSSLPPSCTHFTSLHCRVYHCSHVVSCVVTFRLYFSQQSVYFLYICFTLCCRM